MNISFTILLSTFNGQQFIDKFLNSLADQEYSNFKVIVRDDGSTDGTRLIIDRWAKDGCLDIIYQFGENIGWRDSFNLLFDSIPGSYFLFADQDDVWSNDKLSTLAKFIEQKNISESDTILIVHNANIIDLDDVLLDSNVLLGYNSFDRIKNRIPYMSGGLYGCTICYTSALRNAASILKAYKFIAHDHKCLLMAYYYGKIYYIDEPLINWRKHRNSSNVSGFIIYFDKLAAIIKLAFVESKLSSASSIMLLILQKIYFIFFNLYYRK